MNFWRFVLLGLSSASLLLIHHCETQSTEQVDKPTLFFLREKSEVHKAKISLVNPFSNKIIGYKISTNQQHHVTITNSKTMSSGYILASQQKLITIKYSGNKIEDDAKIKFEWVVLDPISLNPEIADPQALKTLFLKFGRAAVLLECKEAVARLPDIVRVPSPTTASHFVLGMELLSVANLFKAFLVIFITHALISLITTVFS